MHKDTGGHGMEMPRPGDVSCSPTWAQPSTDGAFVFVACNKSSEIVEVDANSWKVTRRISARHGRLQSGRDQGRAETDCDEQARPVGLGLSTSKAGRELARIPTKRKVLHGVAVSPDSRYAFVSVEGVGSEPGTVEVIDLEALKTVAYRRR